MDPQDIQAKVVGFAHRLLEEAQGDPLRALGLLVLVLEGLQEQDTEQYAHLVTEVRRVLLPEGREQAESERAVQHLAGEMSWEGYQHCIRCGLVIVKQTSTHNQGFPVGYVYQVRGRFRLESPGNHAPCLV